MFSWTKFSLRRLYGLDKKTNVMDVADGYSLECENVFQDGFGRISKKRGTKPMFTTDGVDGVTSIGACTLNGQKYYFKFSGGDFHYSTTKTGALSALSPSPEIGESIWWAVVGDKLYFVDGVNALRYFDGTSVLVSSILARPTAAPIVAGGAGTFTYLYTRDNGLGESPGSPITGSKLSAQNNTIPNAQISTGDKIRVYSRPDTVAATSLNVTGTSGGSNVTYGADDGGNFALVVDGAVDAVITTVAIVDGLNQLYTELGLAVNKSAPIGLEGITSHYGRLVGWMGDYVYNSKITNSDSWPDDSAQSEAFTYGVELGNGFAVSVCISFLESLYVFKPGQVIVFGGIGPTDTGQNAYSFRRLESNGNGCIAGKSAVVIDKYLVYLSRNGFFSTNGTDPTRVGEKIEPDIQNISLSSLQSAVAFYHKRDGIYACSVGSPSVRRTYTLDVREDNGEMVGWFTWFGVAIMSVFYDEDSYLAGLYNGLCVFEDITAGSSQFSDATREVITSANVNTGTDVLTVVQNYATGTAITFRTSGTPPSPLAANTVYYAINVSPTEIRLATSSAAAFLGTAIDLTTAGSGSFSLIVQTAFEAFYSTNWLNFKAPSYVKKLGKLGVLLDVTASNIEIEVFAAYEWSNTFIFQKTVIVSSSNTWGSGTWGSFIWGAGAIGTPRNVAISRRKCRAVRYKFANSSADSNFNLLGFEQNFDVMRNRGNFS